MRQEGLGKPLICGLERPFWAVFGVVDGGRAPAYNARLGKNCPAGEV